MRLNSVSATSCLSPISLSVVTSACVCPVALCQVVDVSKQISDVPEWFKGARLNYAENLLKHADQDKVALYAASECVLTGSVV